MKKVEILEGVVKEIRFPNKGILEIEGAPVVVKNAVPGQKIRFSVTKARSGRGEGRLLEVLEKAPGEIEPPCPHFETCGGCTYQNLPYEQQLAMKSSVVEKLLREVCPDLNFEGIKGSPREKEYRNKMEFSFGDAYKDGPLALGMHKRGSFYDIVTVDQCQIVEEDFRKILSTVLDFAAETGFPYYHKLRHTGFWRHLLVRKGLKTGEVLVAVVTSSQNSVDMKELAERLKALSLDGELVGVLHIINDSLADVVQCDESRTLFGRDFLYEELLGLKFKISPFSFFQTNSFGAEVLYETARGYVGETKDKVIYDLYSGTGTIAQILAPVAKKVVGVEIVEEAVEAAKVNAGLNHLDNCDFHAGDVLKVIDELSEVPDLIVLDPPRDGINPKALEKIIRFGVDRMVYISCKPTSLARDLVTLQSSGYKVEKCCCIDLFPSTYHCETVVLLSKGMVDSRKVKVDFSLEDMDLSEFKGKATYEQIKAYVLEQTGLKVSSLYIAQIKKKCGLDVGENFNLPKFENARQPQCTPEKEDAIIQAFRHFGIV